MEVSTRGYVAANLNDILYRAGATKGGMYFHFENKLALMTAVAGEADRSWNRFARDVSETAPQTPDDIADAIVRVAQSSVAVTAGLMLRSDPEFRWTTGLHTPGNLDAALDTVLGAHIASPSAAAHADKVRGVTAVLTGSVRIGSINTDSAVWLRTAIADLLR